LKTVSFFWKVFVGTVAVIVITAFVVYLAALTTIERDLEQEAEQRVAYEAGWAAELCEQAFDRAKGTFDSSRFAALAQRFLSSRFTLVLPNGRVFYDSHQDPSMMDELSSRAEIRTPGKPVTRFSRTLLEEMTYFALPVIVDGELRGHARLAVAADDREARLARLRGAIRNGALLAAAVSLSLAGLLARRVTQPLSQIAELVTEIGAHQTTERLDVSRGDEVGRLARAVNLMADELKGQVARVERDRAEREAIFTALANGLLVVDQERRVLFINQQALALLGDVGSPQKGKPVWELTRNRALLDVVERCLAQEARTSGEARIQGGEGERGIELTAVPMAGESGDLRGCVLELRDITDLRRLEAVRKDFVSNVSHELKTPLTAMRGYTEALLQDEAMPEATRRAFVEKAHRNTERLVAIVGDLLSLSRLESDGRELSFEDLDLARLAGSALEDLNDLAESRQTQLTLEAPQPTPRVRADAQALGMAISNLVSNAIQHSPGSGRVRVVIGREGTDARIDVIDRGPGIPHHEQERIFERFYRVDRARSRKLGGTGLGLSIVRHVMAAHGGRIELQSEPGKGSRFSLFLPLA
jgi:two-component system phosphate regulon sensor histidine kinase PhoR